MPRHLLVADDQPGKLDHLSAIAYEASDSGTVIHKARSAREAMMTVAKLGDRIDEAVIDFDFFGEKETGADIIAAVRKQSRDAHITCATAREDSALEEARALTIAAGANTVVCAVAEGFEQELRGAIAA